MRVNPPHTLESRALKSAGFAFRSNLRTSSPIQVQPTLPHLSKFGFVQVTEVEDPHLVCPSSCFVQALALQSWAFEVQLLRMQMARSQRRCIHWWHRWAERGPGRLRRSALGWRSTVCSHWMEHTGFTLYPPMVSWLHITVLLWFVENPCGLPLDPAR